MPKMSASFVCLRRSKNTLMHRRENTTALHAAVNMNLLDIVRLLLRFGADANAIAKCADATPTCILASHHHSIVAGTTQLLCLWLFS